MGSEMCIRDRGDRVVWEFLPYHFGTGESTGLEGVDDGLSLFYTVEVVYKAGQNRATLADCENEV